MAPIPQVNGFCADKVAESNKGPSRAVPGLSRLGKRGIMGSVASSLGSSSTSSATTTYFTGMSNYSTDLNNAISREVQIADMPIQLPLTPTRAIELLHDAGLPPGVLNLIHGDKASVDALLHHPLVKAVSFVGSTPVARYIYRTAAAEGKRVQALGGAKNHLIVMPDADMPKTVEAIIGSAFGAAGERCLAGSVLVPVGDAAGPLLELLVERTRNMTVGDGSRAGT